MNTFFQKALYLVVTVYPDIGRSIRRIICLIFLSLTGFFVTIPSLSQSWVVQNSGTSQTVNEIYFINSNTGYASCNGGILLKTSNGGENWIILPGPYSGNLAGVLFFDQNTGLVFGNPIFKTTNAGLNWAQVANLSGTLHHCRIADNNTIYGCQPFMLSKSTDQGSTWSTTSGTPAWITTSADFITSLTGWVTTVQPQGFPTPTTQTVIISKTTNGGANWFSQFSESAAINANTLVDTDFPTIDTGFVIGKTGNSILRTLNAGTNWTEIPLGSAGFKDIFFLNSKTGWAVSDSVIFKTINAGLVWTHAYAPVNSGMSNLFFWDSMTGWIGGSNGLILKSTNGGVTAIANVSSTIPSNYSLAQNYPNPFNPQTKIKFDVPANVKGQTSNVKLVIYDLLGREIATLVNEELKPGKYEADWDGSNFSSGVYFYKMNAGDFVVTKKMLMVK